MRVSEPPIAVLSGALSITWMAVTTACQIELTEKSHPILGAILSLLFTAFLLIAVLYWSSPRFSAGNAERSLADFKRWARECTCAAWRTIKLLLKWAGGLTLAWSLAFAGYQFADRKDRIMHNYDLPVWVPGEWMVGEYRNCDMPLGVSRLFCSRSGSNGSGLAAFPDSVSDGDLWAAVGAAYNRQAQPDWSALDRYFKVLPIRFYGRLERPERDHPREILSWRCQRDPKRLKCEPLD
jgi:hypothetical protein